MGARPGAEDATGDVHTKTPAPVTCQGRGNRMNHKKRSFVVSAVAQIIKMKFFCVSQVVEIIIELWG